MINKQGVTITIKPF